MNQGVTYLKKYYGAKYLILIGYSGGGTIAALLSAQRQDVIQLMTIAAPLDTQAWTSLKHLTPLEDSLNPADAWRTLYPIKQTHWIGSEDSVVPKEIVLSFAQKFPTAQKPKIMVIPHFDHQCCWVKDWPHLKPRGQCLGENRA